MNCVKCPISEECKVGKMMILGDSLEAVSVPTKVTPYSPEECLLVKLLIAVEVLKSKSESPE